MSWLTKLRRDKPRQREKQARLSKPPKDYNGSKPRAGKFAVEFIKASDISKSD